MTITITAFERSPDGGRGLARDTRVRWALEEVRQPYVVRPLSFRAIKDPAHLALHPFGQIPTYEECDLALFETGVCPSSRVTVTQVGVVAPGRPSPALPEIAGDAERLAISRPPRQR